MVTGENLARQHWIVWIVSRCLCEDFRERLGQTLGGHVELPDDWVTTSTLISETGREMLRVPSGQRRADNETW